MKANFQRQNSTSNASEGNIFELLVKGYFNKTYNLGLTKNIKVDIGISTKVIKKSKTFDLGRQNEIIIECKSHSWTETSNIPSAKLTTRNEAMYFFHLVPKGLRKIFVVEKFYSDKRQETLAGYYLRTYHHLIPDDVELWEFDRKNERAARLK